MIQTISLFSKNSQNFRMIWAKEVLIFSEWVGDFKFREQIFFLKLKSFFLYKYEEFFKTSNSIRGYSLIIIIIKLNVFEKLMSTESFQKVLFPSFCDLTIPINLSNTWVKLVCYGPPLFTIRLVREAIWFKDLPISSMFSSLRYCFQILKNFLQKIDSTHQVRGESFLREDGSNFDWEIAFLFQWWSR